ncbi:MAG: bifunctional glutamate N-acetyltransferase/amino-acid acetyltransferase ArgJ [Acidiferrobacterales bacterium]
MAVGLKNITALEKISGIKLGSAAAEIRYQDRDDMLVILAEEGSRFAGVFTQNKFSAAPVVISRKHLQVSEPRACLVNAGNANAGTGSRGEQDALDCCQVLAQNLGIKMESVLPFSTGVIGETLPVSKMSAAIPACLDNMSADGWVSAAHTIMTTDTVAKGVTSKVKLNGGEITITGITKGSGMICPDMATLLSFVATDACIEKTLLQETLEDVVAESFNRTTVDGDTSTNDSCILIATGKCSHTEITNRDDENYALFHKALKKVFIYLAQAIIRDAEGATKFVTINVINAASDSDATEAAKTIAHSPLVKTALFASDPNWGRILAALGRAHLSDMDIQKVNLSINGVTVLSNGQVDAAYTEEQGQAAMTQEDIVIEVDLALANGSSRVWTSDLSHEYIRINAEYRS